MVKPTRIAQNIWEQLAKYSIIRFLSFNELLHYMKKSSNSRLTYTAIEKGKLHADKAADTFVQFLVEAKLGTVLPSLETRSKNLTRKKEITQTT